ncbi:MAG: mycothiol synthase [Actinobacteria bacterium]|nr:mycothiol synthase [Actinomycetota bacterium]NIS37343.1 mycothiol synthase [Actinomycetota bacterium]NIT99226.1 mycothiol synthase [Actinomycetota bacterium]NIU22827.1 mycothiol synthase [Actinomycetota bacterium]NIU71775.1 mycothiol synthase [Actinomycetota bacterium]
MELTVDRSSDGEFRWVIVVGEDRTGRSGSRLRDALDAALRDLDGGVVQLWIRDVDDAAHEAALAAGFEPYRDLWQLRCPLPAPPSGLDTRAFTDADIEEFVAVNNRAFHWHPEQGGLTVESVRASMREPWFDPDGFRLLHLEERLAGFCWTKIHADHDPPLGEIYVIAVDPDFHGRGLGKPMTLAGLEWLGARGLRHGMLYVESDNDPANATYAALGFVRHHTDRAYRLEP